MLPSICPDCSLPVFYDGDRHEYIHAVAREHGCFNMDDRDEPDANHPHVKEHVDMRLTAKEARDYELGRSHPARKRLAARARRLRDKTGKTVFVQASSGKYLFAVVMREDEYDQ